MHSKLLENVAAETAELNDTPSQLRDNLKRLVDHLMNYVVSRFFASLLIYFYWYLIGTLLILACGFTLNYDFAYMF